ncbi:MAG: ParB/RepB/Spo0J family partition protein [Solirubrobacterales bacterium]|nr:ParB/RepB/Spo0J family partition protein [Solirubrobacterales bacterium]
MSVARSRGLNIDDPVAAPAVKEYQTTGDPLSRLQNIPLEQIQPNPGQPRKRIDQDSLCSLAESISERGVLQPVIVRGRDDGRFELIAGERRWRAAGIAGRATIPALVEEGVDGCQALEFALIENVVRQDLTPIEEARTIATLLDDLKVTAGALAKRLGRSRSDLVHSVRLLELPDEAIGLIDRRTLTKGHGKVLLSEPDHRRRRALARRAAKEGWSVRRLEAEIAIPSLRRRSPAEPHPDHSAAAVELQDAISRATGSNANARPYGGGYQITIDRQGADSLVRLLEAKGDQT